jgi:hypothetical protein
MSSIRETVEAGLSSQGLGGYASQATPIISSLEDRETEMSSRLIEFATEQGLGREQAVQALNTIGMTVKVESNGNGANEDAISAIESTLVAIQQQLRDLRG